MSYKWNNRSIKTTYGFKLEELNSDENRFYALYFLDNLTGSLMLSKKYTNKTKFLSHGDLISGFLNALNQFITELNPGSINDEIQEINFKETRILYERKGRLSVIAITKKTNLQVERVILHQIMEDFYNKFEYAINHFNGNIDPSILKYKKRLENMNFNSLFKFDIHL
jgi:hypothetical protein